MPSLVKYRRLLGEVLLVSLFLQLFALISPLFFQVVMDKLLVHRGVSTLDVLVIGLVVVVLFESVLTTLRTYVFSHTTSRIDVELGTRLFDGEVRSTCGGPDFGAHGLARHTAATDLAQRADVMVGCQSLGKPRGWHLLNQRSLCWAAARP